MKCEKAQEVFSEYLEGTLERPMMFMFEHHLESCPACGRDYEKFRTTWEMIDSLPEVEVPTGFRESVMSEIRARQTAVPARRKWSWDLGSIIGARVQVRAVAMAAAVVLFGVMLVQTSPWQVVTSNILKPELPQVTDLDKQGGIEWKMPAEAVIDPGLDVQVTATTGSDDRILYSIDLTPASVPVEPRAYLMNQGRPVFNPETLKESNRIFAQPLDTNETGNISVVAHRHAAPDVVYVVWEYKKMVMSRAIFLPTNLNTETERAFSVSNTTLYSALQKLSGEYGVVVVVDGSLAGKIGSVKLASADLDMALSTMLENLPLRWKPAGENIYEVERKL